MSRALLTVLLALALAPPAAAADGVALSAAGAQLSGTVRPAQGGVVVELLRDDLVVSSTRTRAGGTFSLGRALPGYYRAHAGDALSPEVRVLVQPALDARLAGTLLVGEQLRLIARVRPTGAGRLAVRVLRAGKVTYERLHGETARVRLSTGRPERVHVVVALRPAEGFAGASRTLRAEIVPAQLDVGARGFPVRTLQRRLRELRYALPSVSGLYERATWQAVLAFQKVQGLPWTGRTDARTWRALRGARTPMPRYRGIHIEVNKSRQVLYVVRGSRVDRIVHVSTGATGNTPVGRWRIYRKVVGWDWVLWYPLYFLRGFAIHGYPSVPAYPASHGCVRVPMWIAPTLFARHGYGHAVYVYS